MQLCADQTMNCIFMLTIKVSFNCVDNDSYIFFSYALTRKMAPHSLLTSASGAWWGEGRGLRPVFSHLYYCVFLLCWPLRYALF